MRHKNIFNFQDQIERLQSQIKLQPQHFDEISFQKEQVIMQDVKKQVCIFSKQEEHKIKKQFTQVAQIQTKECLLYAFCLANPIESKITIELIKKSTGKAQGKTLKKINVQVSYLELLFDQDELINLLAATKCGSIFIYKSFEEKELTVESIKISSNQITYLLAPTDKNWIFVLNKAGTIYLVNFLLGQIFFQFKCSLPLIDDPHPRLILDSSQTFIGHVFSYGRIIIWQISEDIKITLRKGKSIRSEAITLTNDQEAKQEIQGKQKDQEVSQKSFKKIILRSKMSIASSLVEGISWVDFIGIFFCVIDLNGYMKLLAININEFNESQQFFTIISEYSICKEKIIGQNHEKESIADAISLKSSNGIIVGKNIEVISLGKRITTRCFLQKYLFDEEFRVSKILTVSFSQINLMKQFLISHSCEYILIKNKSEYNLIRDRSRKLN